jgi:hypothetical protein
MNNQQFRRLLIDTPSQQSSDGSANKSPGLRTPGTALGTRKHSSIPMTPYVREYFVQFLYDANDR